MLSNLITDRTLSDFTRWLYLRDKGYANMTASEREEWAADMKGSYNASDLNRVGAVLNYLRDRLTEAAYLTGKEFAMRENWQKDEIPEASGFHAYINAVETIRGAMSQKPTTPPTPENDGSLDYQGANNIEQIMLDIDELITNMLKSRYFIGELFSGEI
jgi:hypothetical protein